MGVRTEERDRWGKEISVKRDALQFSCGAHRDGGEAQVPERIERGDVESQVGARDPFHPVDFRGIEALFRYSADRTAPSADLYKVPLTVTSQNEIDLTAPTPPITLDDRIASLG